MKPARGAPKMRHTLKSNLSVWWRTPTSRQSGLLLGLAWGFVIIGAVTLALADPARLQLRHLVALVVGWTFTWSLGYLYLHLRLPQADPWIVPVVALLTGWGLLLQARLAPAFLLRQTLWLLLGVLALCITATLPTLPRLLRRYRYTLLVVGLLQLGTTLIFGVNPSGQGQRLWLGLRGVYFQPSEPLKILLVIYLAAYLSDRREIVQIRGQHLSLWLSVLAPMSFMFGLAMLLLGWQQDLGAALLFYLTFLAMLYLAWGKLYHIGLGLLSFAPVAWVGYHLSARVALRFSIWLNPWAPEQVDRAFQILQSLFALAAGGVLGQGLGQGSPTLIPVVHSDFVYAALAEEFGLLGACACLALVALLVERGLKLAQHLPSPFESLLAGGIAALLGIQTWVITAGTLKLIPLTGVTLPFLSYGGSSLLTMLVAMGLLLNLSAPHRPTLNLALATENAPPLRKTASRLGQVLLALFSLIALVNGNWSVLRASELRTYPSNARYVLAEAKIQRGRIIGRGNTVLADIDINDQGFVTRTYPVPEAAPVLGYATLDYGTAGIEDTCDAVLRGEIKPGSTPTETQRLSLWETLRMDLLHQAPQGHTVRLTLDAPLQRQAQAQLADKQGAAIVMDARTGDILALASAPTYDPAQVAAEWETLRDAPQSPLLNRATQGLAQPGAALETVVLSIALEQSLIQIPGGPIPTLTDPIYVNDAKLTCRTQPDANTWKAALAATCPAPFATLATDLGAAGLTKGFRAWGLLDAPSFALPTVRSDWDANAIAPIAEALGQGDLLITPLQMLNIPATLANNGTRPVPHLLIEPERGCDTPTTDTSPTHVINPETAALLRERWTRQGIVAGHLGTAQAGPERTLAWFLGFNADAPRYAVAVLLENPQNSQNAARVGRALIEQAVIGK